MSVHLTNRSRKPFTLLEICVCLLILGLVSGFLGVKIKDAIDHHRFVHELSKFAADIKYVQSLALSYQSEFTVAFDAHGYKVSTDEPKNLFRALPKGTFKTVELLKTGDQEVKRVTLTVFSTGRVEPSKRLTFHAHREVCCLDLGTPLQIKIQMLDHDEFL